MKITDELIDHLSHLAKLKFEGDERVAIKKDMEKIVGFINKLSEINTDQVEPLIFMTEEVKTLREDIAIDSINQEQALRNAPKRDSDYFRIPKVLDK